MMANLKDKNGDWDCKKILMAGGKFTTLRLRTNWPDDVATIELDLINLDGQWFWTLTGNSHCFGPFNTQNAALKDVAR